jgi:predicted metalloprotease with PDZ domain
MKIVAVAAAALILSLSQLAAATTDAILLRVDATNAAGRLFHSHMTIPVQGGPVTLYYPKWIPGEHGPTGPLLGVAGVVITADGKPVTWTRDPLEMYALRVNVPATASALEVDLDYIAPSESANFTAGASTTSRLAVLSWNTVVLYPGGMNSDTIRVRPTLRIPAGWSSATGMERKPGSGEEIAFEEVSLTTLIDSPVLMGANFKRVDVPSSSAQHHAIDIVADGESALVTPDDFTSSYTRLVDEAGALFGARHYRHYDWLLTLSDHVAHFGLEHHESSDDRMNEATLAEPATRKALAQLLAHEYVHSWNGKYRRPAGLATPSYEQPMTGELLWVYEGLTQYLGKLLPYRAGIWTADDYRDALAATATHLVTQTGRTWRPLSDTAVEAQVLYNAPDEWESYRRSTDFYEEGVLLWLDVDTTIRARSGGKKSLDDFCRAFYGGDSGHAALKPYTFEDVVRTLNSVQPLDWASFLNQRLGSLAADAPTGGITAAGWHIVYNDTENSATKRDDDRYKRADLRNSIGMVVKEDGTIIDVVPGSPAAKAGVTPGAKLIAVNTRRFAIPALRDAVRDAGHAPAAGRIPLILANGDFYTTPVVDYGGGLRYPHLERTGAGTDLIEALGKPLTVAAH